MRCTPTSTTSVTRRRTSCARSSSCSRSCRITSGSSNSPRASPPGPLWNLADSKTRIDELRRYLRDESVDQFEEVPGLRFKTWISDEVTERWGAVYLWESAEAARQELPFDVEATCSRSRSSRGGVLR